jgi:hypothetical protein
MSQIFSNLEKLKSVHMAKQNTILKYSGKLGDQIGYRRGKQYFLRQASAVVRQTTATKRAAKDFGTASKCSRMIRHALQEHLLHCYDSSLTNRLNKVFGEIIRADDTHLAGTRIPLAANMDALAGFQMNNAATIQQLVGERPIIEKDGDSISISLPVITFRKTKATHLAIRAVALSVNFSQNITQQTISNTIMIKRGQEHSPVSLTLPTSGNEQTIIFLEVQSFMEMNGQLYPSADRKAYALDIIAILPPIAQPKEKKKKFHNNAPRLWGIPPIPQPLRLSRVTIFHSIPEGIALPEG